MSNQGVPAEPRLASINRQQLVLRSIDVEQLIDEDHSARLIWQLIGPCASRSTARQLYPSWLALPAMMRIVLSTPHVLQRLDRSTRPFNFLLCPLIDTVAGYPAVSIPITLR